MLRILSRNLGSVCILCLQGKLVIGENDRLVRTVQSVSDAGTVVLDMAHVSMIDANGLGVLLELREELQAKGIEFELRNVTNLVSQVLELTRLNSVFTVTSGVEFFSTLSCGWITTTGSSPTVKEGSTHRPLSYRCEPSLTVGLLPRALARSPQAKSDIQSNVYCAGIKLNSGTSRDSDRST